MDSSTAGKLSNGEVPKNAPSYPDALKLIERYRRDLDGYRMRVMDLEAEREENQKWEAGATDVRAVLTECKKVLKLRTKIVPGSEGWRKVKARLNDFDVVELKAVPHGALKSSWYRAKRHRLRPQFLYRDHDAVDELVELGLGLIDQTLSNGLALSRDQEQAVSKLKHWEFSALDKCDCGCFRFQHSKNLTAGPMLGWWPCSTCACTDFDDLFQRSDAWLREKWKLRKESKLDPEKDQAALASLEVHGL